jgi:prophage DNA circulation protein
MRCFFNSRDALTKLSANHPDIEQPDVKSIQEKVNAAVHCFSKTMLGSQTQIILSAGQNDNYSNNLKVEEAYQAFHKIHIAALADLSDMRKEIKNAVKSVEIAAAYKDEVSAAVSSIILDEEILTEVTDIVVATVASNETLLPVDEPVDYIKDDHANEEGELREQVTSEVVHPTP